MLHSGSSNSPVVAKRDRHRERRGKEALELSWVRSLLFLQARLLLLVVFVVTGAAHYDAGESHPPHAMLSTRWSCTGPPSTLLIGQPLPLSDRSPQGLCRDRVPRAHHSHAFLRPTRILENAQGDTHKFSKISVAQHPDDRACCSGTPPWLHGRIEHQVRPGSHSGTPADEGRRNCEHRLALRTADLAITLECLRDYR